MSWKEEYTAAQIKDLADRCMRRLARYEEAARERHGVDKDKYLNAANVAAETLKFYDQIGETNDRSE